MHKFFSFDEIQLIYFFLCCLCFCCYIKEIIAKPNVIKFCAVISPKYFYIFSSYLDIWTLSGLIFVYGVRWRPGFVLLTVWVFIFPNTCSKDCLSLLNGKHFEKYRIFQTVRLTPRPPIWEENGGASYSPNAAYLTCCWGVGICGGTAGFFSLFSSKT